VTTYRFLRREVVLRLADLRFFVVRFFVRRFTVLRLADRRDRDDLRLAGFRFAVARRLVAFRLVDLRFLAGIRYHLLSKMCSLHSCYHLSTTNFFLLRNAQHVWIMFFFLLSSPKIGEE
jgi:hypothetical protein